MMSLSPMYETDRLILEPFCEKHMTETYRNWFHDPKVTYWNSHGLFPYTTAQMKSFLADIGSGNRIVLAVLAKLPDLHGRSNNIHIGNVSLQSINWINRSAEYAVVIGNKSYWNKGYAAEASQLLFEHGFRKLGLNRIWSGTAITNVGMIKVFKKLWMTQEGRFRQAMFLHGNFIDSVCYGVLAEEFEEKCQG